MVRAAGVRVPRSEAETTRRRLLELDVLRGDLRPAREGEHIVFPVGPDCGVRLPLVEHDFEPQDRRPDSYLTLLDWAGDDAALLAQAPRSFEQLGDIVVAKVPEPLAHRAGDIGDALQRFTRARAVFHDRGVVGLHRTRDLVRIAGKGDALTQVNENGVRLWVDLSKAYYSARLAGERARVCALVQPGEHVIDLFAGVAPFAVQAALRGAQVEAIDINADAIDLARRNVGQNKVADRVRLHVGDARRVAQGMPGADRVVMNLPHGARDFLDVAAPLLRPGATLHYHEILPRDDVPARTAAILRELEQYGVTAAVQGVRTVRTYSAVDDHVAIDLRREG